MKDGGRGAGHDRAKVPGPAAPNSPYTIEGKDGIYFLFDQDENLVGTMLQDGNRWRCKPPGKDQAVTVDVPDDELDPVAFVAAQITGA